MRIVLTGLLAAVLVFAMAKPAAANWVIETVDANGHAGFQSSLKLDTGDQPRVSYITKIGNYFSLKYASWSGTSWSIETVEQGQSGISAGWFNSLQLDSNGRPHIAYGVLQAKVVKYAAWNGTQWETKLVDTIEYGGGWTGGYAQTSLALDAQDRPLISYAGNNVDVLGDVDLNLARWNGTSWDIETVDDNDHSGFNTSISMDSHGNPHIVYTAYDDSYNGELRYARWNGSSWDIHSVGPIIDTSLGNCTSAMGPADELSIAYHSTDWSDVHYGEWNGSSFDVELVAEDDWPSGLVSLALEADGTPHIAYTDGYRIRYASWNGSTWVIETVGSGRGDRMSLALDSMGNPWISYSGGGGDYSDLMLAHWVPEPATLSLLALGGLALLNRRRMATADCRSAQVCSQVRSPRTSKKGAGKMTATKMIVKWFVLFLLSVLVVSQAVAGPLPNVVLYDNFDDGNYDGWSVTDPRGISTPAAPTIVSVSGGGYAVAANGSGEAMIFQPISVSSTPVRVEMRARSTRVTEVWLCNGTDFYQMQDYGENDVVRMTKHIEGVGETQFLWQTIANPNDWHTFQFSRDAQGWWSLNMDDGSLVVDDFAQDTEFTSFDGVAFMLRPFGGNETSAIDWVRVSVPEPATLSLLALGGLALIRKRRTIR